ncbi:MAG TPA: hypothetical protein VH762_07290, partial [Gemmatimonadaceae bacterium]
MTDKPSYVAAPGRGVGIDREYTLTVITSFTNTIAQPITLSRCSGAMPYPVYAVTAGPGRRTAAYSPAWFCVGGYDVRVDPGTTHVDTLPLRGPWMVNHREGFAVGAFEGQFRIQFEAQICRDASSSCVDPIRTRVQS